MKVYQVYAVFDNLTEAFLAPNFIETEEEAKRLFQHQINSIPLWKDNASDFDLYQLGHYDAKSGTLVSELHKIAKGTAVLRRENEEE